MGGAAAWQNVDQTTGFYPFRLLPCLSSSLTGLHRSPSADFLVFYPPPYNSSDSGSALPVIYVVFVLLNVY